tara:strand:+ start:1152 stop:3086 length:1935 start_codon:yes stop_codon:yes gene_type:complete
MAGLTIEEMLAALEAEGVPNAGLKEMSVEEMLFRLENPMAPKAYVEGDPSIPYANERPNVFGDVISRMTKPSTDAFQTYMKGAGSSLGQLFGGDSQEDISPTYQQIPSSVPNALRRPAAAVGDYGMGLLSGASAGLGALTGLAGEVFGQSPTGEKRLASDLMAGLEVSAPQLAGSTSQLTRLARQSSSNVIPGGRKFGEITPRMVTARAAEELGVLPTMGMQGRLGSMVESGLEASPISNPFISSRTGKVIDQLDEAAQAASAKAGTATTIETAGEGLTKGAQTWVNKFQKRASDLYGQLDQYVRPDDLLVAPNTVKALEEIVRYADLYPNMSKHIGADKYRGLLQDLKLGGVETAIPYALLKDIRTTYGTSIGNLNGPLAGMDANKLNRIYGALSDDMRMAAEASGPNALKAWERANKFYKGGADRIENVLKPLLDAKTGVDAYKKMENILLEGNVKQSLNSLMRIRNSLPKDDFDTFRSTLINRLGRAKPGAQDAGGEIFSPSVFLTNYNRMEKGPRRIVFGELNEEMSKLAKVVDLAKDASKDLNRSRTATGTMSAGAVLAGSYGVAGSVPMLKAIAIAGAVNAASGLALTSKPFLRGLNAAAKNDLGPLRRIAQSDGIFSADAQTVMRMLAAQQTNEGPQ